MSEAEKINALAAERERLKKLNIFDLVAELGITKQRTATTTAQDVYNDLTKQYKAGEINYTLYENRLKTMRELTGGNKQMKIDLKTIEAAIAYRREKKTDAPEKELPKPTSQEDTASAGRKTTQKNVPQTGGAVKAL